jgi:uncharacterized membrane protein YcaP (DUF421 family)
MERAYEWLQPALGIGLEGKDMGVLQMGLRAAIVFVVTVAIVRLGKKRFLGRATTFDVILGIMLGSIVSRAVTGNAPLVPALGAAAVLMLMHWLFSAIALRSHGFGVLVKGRARLLVQDGRPQDEAMRASHMTEHDLWEDLRGKSVSSLAEVKEARLERSGQLSVVKAKPEPKVVEVAVRDGVQTVRIEIAG